jgi:hydroxypyruvate isomerase
MRVAELAIELELTLGALLAYASYNQPTFARPSKRGTESLETRLAQALGCAQLVGVRWIAVIPGARTGELSRAEQISNAAGLLKECAREAQRGNVTILVETTDHPDCLVRSNEEALELAAAVDSPFCSALLRSDRGQDLASILTGDRAPDYLQLGSIPKRSDRELFARLYRSGYEGVIGIAHEAFYPGKRGEEELLHSYRTANQF